MTSELLAWRILVKSEALVCLWLSVRIFRYSKLFLCLCGVFNSWMEFNAPILIDVPFLLLLSKLRGRLAQMATSSALVAWSLFAHSFNIFSHAVCPSIGIGITSSVWIDSSSGQDLLAVHGGCHVE